MGDDAGCCRCCTGLIFSTGLTALFLWLSLRPSKPTLSIESFYIPALNKTLNSPRNTTIFFDLKLNNKDNKDKGVHYDVLNLTFYYGHNLSFPVANLTIDGFYQGFKKKTHRKMSVQPVGVPWEVARREVENGTTVFRVDLKTKVRYKIIFWRTKRHRIMVGNNVTVNGNGELVKRKEKGVKLSCAHVHVNYFTRVVGIVGFALLVL
ncbi:hypothetical protein ACHQM5_003716 [Ranunculus cassubicifolius]